MLMADEEHKMSPLLAFATGIEFSQIAIVIAVLILAYFFRDILSINKKVFIVTVSVLILLITIPMLIETFPK